MDAMSSRRLIRSPRRRGRGSKEGSRTSRLWITHWAKPVSAYEFTAQPRLGNGRGALERWPRRAVAREIVCHFHHHLSRGRRHLLRWPLYRRALARANHTSLAGRSGCGLDQTRFIATLCRLKSCIARSCLTGSDLNDYAHNRIGMRRIASTASMGPSSAASTRIRKT